MLRYLASSVEIPIGHFMTASNLVYDNYVIYKQSKDFIYIDPKKTYIGPPYGSTALYDFIPELHETNYPIHFYKNSLIIQYIHIYEYNTDIPRTTYSGKNNTPLKLKKQDIINQDVTTQFTLPYIYYLGMGCSEIALREYLCLCLNPGEKAEIYWCWAGTESQKRDKTWDRTVDLNNFILNRDITIPTFEYNEIAKKHFITYVAPLSNNNQINYIDRENIISIYADTHEEFIPYSLAEKISDNFRNE